MHHGVVTRLAPLPRCPYREDSLDSVECGPIVLKSGVNIVETSTEPSPSMLITGDDMYMLGSTSMVAAAVSKNEGNVSDERRAPR